ncbi:MAG TPA: 4'-phosphopantetheinyl transferase superfamily protein, partial [Chloroflexota bacterium]|nr:4'-phosphopantetheinyl transferase superfamily protein [Chloroflexota bacterium]
ERARATRLREIAHRTRFVGVRGWLRTMLAAYLDDAPANLRFTYGSHGKPAIASRNPPDLRFNLSHSADVALLAVTRGREVGVDVELRRGGKLRLAERFFAADEVARLRSLPADEQERAFYRCWTRKEAFVKARGEGLSLPLRRFSVTLGPDEPPAILRVEGDSREVTRWSVHALPEIPGYAAALLVEAPIRSPRCWHWRARPAGQS